MRRLLRGIGTDVCPKSGKRKPPQPPRRPVDVHMHPESICTLCNFGDEAQSIAGNKAILYCPRANELLFGDRIYADCPGGVSMMDIL